MKVNLTNFMSVDDNIYDLILKPKVFDVGGGHIDVDDIDIIKQYPNAKSVRISGLNQKTFEYFITNYGKQFEAISFFKNKGVSDLSLLGTLKNIQFIDYFFNQKVTSLWNMENNTHLRGLSINDFVKLKSIDFIETAPVLELFDIGNKVWSKMDIESLLPLCKSTITHFSFYGNKIKGNKLSDTDFMCLANSNINKLDVNICRFTMKELANIIACIPDVKGTVIKPYIESSLATKEEGTTTCYFLCKGKRTLTKGKDDAKLKEYLLDFEKMVKDLRQ